MRSVPNFTTPPISASGAGSGGVGPSTRLAIESLESRQLLSTYTIEDLGTLGGNGSLANAINAEGQVVGSAQLANGTSHAVLWNPGQAGKDLGTLGGTNSTALGINILGDIVGNADTTTALAQPFEVPSGGSMTDLTNAPPENSLATLLTARGVSDTGVIVGQGLFNAIDLFFTAPYAFDPATGTILALDCDLRRHRRGGRRRRDQGRGQPGITAASCKPSSRMSTRPSPRCPSPRSPTRLESVATGISAPNGSGTQFASGFALDSSGELARGAVDDSDRRPLGHRPRPGPRPGRRRQGTISRAGARGQLAG